MTGDPLVLALDQGTTSSRAILFGRDGQPVASAQQELPQILPEPGHVEHDPEAIWQGQLSVMRQVVERVSVDRIMAIGIANQRETTIVWDRVTGVPVANAIVWQSRVTADRCAAIVAAGHGRRIRELTGLPVDAYFSATKIAHILDSAADLRARASQGELCAGTVDAWLLWRLTGGRVHATDVSNASRTSLLDIRTGAWDPWLCGVFDVPMAVLPRVVSSSGVVAETEPALLGRSVPIAGIAGDQQAATFGQACHATGAAKTTYGTGAFLLRNTGHSPLPSSHGSLATVLWRLADDAPMSYALEGSVFIAGAAVQWLRDGLRAIDAASDVERLAAGIGHDMGVYLVPAFTGLGAPWWDADARGLLIGLTRGTGLPQIARATLDSIAYQVAEVVAGMDEDDPADLEVLRVDGGAARNDALLGFQADLLDVPVERPVVTETTAAGAAFLAGIASGLWADTDEVAATWRLERRFEPTMGSAERARLMAGWRRAAERSLGWATSD